MSYSIEKNPLVGLDSNKKLGVLISIVGIVIIYTSP